MIIKKTNNNIMIYTTPFIITLFSPYLYRNIPGDSLIRGHFLIEPVQDYGELGCFDLFSKKKFANSLIIAIKKIPFHALKG